MEQLFRSHKICAILRGLPDDICIPYAKAAYRGGIRLFEVAMNSEHAARQLERLIMNLEGDAIVGAGTVTNVGRCEEAKAAGAAFFLTPSVSVPVLEYCSNHNIPLLPGVMTPSEVALCVEYGYRTMKLFPAGDLPPAYIKSLKGPFEETEYVAVGGVRQNNINSFLDNGFIGVGIGSGLIPDEFKKKGMWEESASYVRKITSQL